ncbi:Cytochrome b [Limimonas halophila]|uniref:Cytochrome b n=1 Tax=Limimonas halophila TaxID=1082479 RepID=A0A1G7QKJ7_9PROT|nr:cytochrome b/b6 domain-containing protein [Limimonas halophila]SDF99026.1 Cytochrome b [Limimonas halophila]
MTVHATGGHAADTPRVSVWDPLLRALHWSLATSFAVAYLTGETWMSVHELAGYAIVAIVGVRALWGLVGPRHARFDDFVPGPRALLAYLRALAAGRAPRHLGHNPAGGAMIVALLASLLAASATGILTDSLGKAAEELHELAANACLILVLIHIAGVVATSLLHHENLVAAMITGRKRSH